MSSDSEDDREALLQALQAHGQQFLSAFGEHAKQLQSLSGQSYAESSKSGLGKRKASIESGSDDSDSDPSGEGEEDSDDDDDEEWQGIDDSPPRPHQKSYIEVDYSKSLQKSSEKLPKPSKKAFMSSKIGKLKEDESSLSQSSGRPDRSDDDVNEKSNIANDALLHRLIHTKLLSSSLEPDLNLSGAQRRKALEGRIDELVGSSKLGKGEARIRKDEHNKASKVVRDGLKDKKKTKIKKQLEMVKELGNFHPSLKAVYQGMGDEEDKRPRQKRERGLRMGVGKFAGGVLRLSRSEIQSVQGSGSGPGPGSRSGKDPGGGKSNKKPRRA